MHESQTSNDGAGEKAGRSRGRDPELEAMAKVNAALEPLDLETKRRIIAWAHDRHTKGCLDRLVGALMREPPAAVRSSGARELEEHIG